MVGKTTRMSDLALCCAAVGLVSAFVSYKMTVMALLKAEQTRRLERAKDVSEERVKKNQKQINKGLPSGSTGDGMAIDEIYVWDLEDLKTRFLSEG